MTRWTTNGTVLRMDAHQYETDEAYEPQRQDAEEHISDSDANRDGNEGADDRVRIEQPSGDEAPRA